VQSHKRCGLYRGGAVDLRDGVAFVGVVRTIEGWCSLCRGGAVYLMGGAVFVWVVRSITGVGAVDFRGGAVF